MKWVELEMYSNCAALPNQPWIVPSKWRMNKFVVPQTIAVNWKSKSIWSKQQKLYCGPIYGVDLIVGEGFVHGFSAVFSVRRRLEHSCASINWIRNLPCFISENIYFFLQFLYEFIFHSNTNWNIEWRNANCDDNTEERETAPNPHCNYNSNSNYALFARAEQSALQFHIEQNVSTAVIGWIFSISYILLLFTIQVSECVAGCRCTQLHQKWCETRQCSGTALSLSTGCVNFLHKSKIEILTLSTGAHVN